LKENSLFQLLSYAAVLKRDDIMEYGTDYGILLQPLLQLVTKNPNLIGFKKNLNDLIV
jgi:hypothetical protein